WTSCERTCWPLLPRAPIRRRRRHRRRDPERSALSCPNPLLKPSNQGFECHCPGHHRQDHFFDGDIKAFADRNPLQSEAASFEKCVGENDCGSLVSVNESTVSGHGLDKSGRLALDRPVVPGERPAHSRLDQSQITNAREAAERQRSLMSAEGVGQCEAV